MEKGKQAALIFVVDMRAKFLAFHVKFMKGIGRIEFGWMDGTNGWMCETTR